MIRMILLTAVLTLAIWFCIIGSDDKVQYHIWWCVLGGMFAGVYTASVVKK